MSKDSARTWRQDDSVGKKRLTVVTIVHISVAKEGTTTTVGAAGRRASTPPCSNRNVAAMDVTEEGRTVLCEPPQSSLWR